MEQDPNMTPMAYNEKKTDGLYGSELSGCHNSRVLDSRPVAEESRRSKRLP